MESKNVKLAVFVPLSHADAVRRALGEAGAGKIGNYDFARFRAGERDGFGETKIQIP
jgi:hypothetical protein